MTPLIHSDSCVKRLTNLCFLPEQVYAFGILMWEMYTAQRPYGNMKQQQLVEEVCL